MFKNNDKETEMRINKEIDKFNMAYEVEDREGNIFNFSHIENGIPLYRGNRGSKHIYDMTGLKIIEKHIKLT